MDKLRVIFFLVECREKTDQVKIGWVLRLSECMDEFYLNTEQLPKDLFADIFQRPFIGYHPNKYLIKYMKQNLTTFSCGDTMTIDLKTKYQPPIVIKQVFILFLICQVYFSYK